MNISSEREEEVFITVMAKIGKSSFRVVTHYYFRRCSILPTVDKKVKAAQTEIYAAFRIIVSKKSRIQTQLILYLTNIAA